MEIVKSEIKEYFRDVVLEETNPRLDIFFEEINDSLYFTLEGILRCEYNMKILTYTTIIKKFEFEGNLKNVVIDKVHELGIMEEFINQAFTFTKSQDPGNCVLTDEKSLKEKTEIIGFENGIGYNMTIDLGGGRISMGHVVFEDKDINELRRILNSHQADSNNSSLESNFNQLATISGANKALNNLKKILSELTIEKISEYINSILRLNDFDKIILRKHLLHTKKVSQFHSKFYQLIEESSSLKRVLAFNNVSKRKLMPSDLLKYYVKYTLEFKE